MEELVKRGVCLNNDFFFASPENCSTVTFWRTYGLMSDLYRSLKIDRTA